MKKVMVFGTFDILHPGHLNFFRQAREYGDYLICVVARDTTVAKMKKEVLNNENIRFEGLKNIPSIDQVMLGDKEDPFRVIEKIKPDIICLGYDQISFTKTLQDELTKRNISAKILRLNPYREDIYKSSKLRNSD